MTIAIRSLAVPREHRQIFQNQVVSILATFLDVSNIAVLLDPVYSPLISLYSPADIALFTDVPMVKVSQGLYSYPYQTTSASSVGLYTATVKAVHNDSMAIIYKRLVFKILEADSLASFSYLGIRDQSGAIWYWYIAGDNTLASSATVPSFLGKQAVAISLVTIPSWIQVNNPTPAVRYIYPSLAGEPTVTATQPAVGSGQIGSPVFVGMSGSSFVLALNISDEIILNTV